MVIVDEYRAIIEMMIPVIEAMPGFAVVGHATCAEAAFELCRRERPDVMVLDLIPRGAPAVALLHDLRRQLPLLRVLVFSGNLWSAALRGILSGGVHGVVEKMSTLAEFRTALEAVSAGRVYFSPFVSAQITELLRGGHLGDKPVAALTTREKTILHYLAEGFCAKEIAAMLGVSVYTVLNHRTNLMHKVGLRSTAQLSLCAAQLGINGDWAEAGS